MGVHHMVTSEDHILDDEDLRVSGCAPSQQSFSSREKLGAGQQQQSKHPAQHFLIFMAAFFGVIAVQEFKCTTGAFSGPGAARG